MNTTTDLLGGASLNKDTYIGYLKIKNGGMKVIPGDIDNEIINKRNIVLEKLEKVLSGGNKLKEKNLEKYFKALGGKYIRNDMCLSGNIADCKKAKQLSLGGANKLMELSKGKYDKELLEFKFKGAAPVLYEKYVNMFNRKNTGGMNRYNEGGEVLRRSDNGSRDLIRRTQTDPYDEETAVLRRSDNGSRELIKRTLADPYDEEMAVLRRSDNGSRDLIRRTQTDPYDEETAVLRRSDNGSRELIKRTHADPYDESGGYKYYDNNMYGGSNEDIGDLEKLRFDIGRYQYFSGGSINRICYSDIELNKLRGELDLIRG
jgi:hypothetical protein